MKIRFDINSEYLAAGEPVGVSVGFPPGRDVTKKFRRDIARPIQAVIFDPMGPGGGNPIVEFTFRDEDHAWEWASNELDMDPDEFELHLQHSLVES